jgi:hypothetical protein
MNFNKFKKGDITYRSENVDSNSILYTDIFREQETLFNRFKVKIGTLPLIQVIKIQI